MARNKYPEKTIEKILQVSLTLFSQKGYDKTTIQDIVVALGMSKGAIYHHFKSKEDIAIAICEHHYSNMNADTIFEDASLTGLEKIRKIALAQVSDSQKHVIDILQFNLLNDPKFYMMSSPRNFTQNSTLLAPFIELGIQDGSIRAQDAHRAAEVVSLLLNTWIYSPIVAKDVNLVPSKISYLRYLLAQIGIPLINDEIEHLTVSYFTYLMNHT